MKATRTKSAARQSQTDPEASIEQLLRSGTTIETRLELAMRALTLIAAAGDSSVGSGRVDRGEVLTAISRYALDARDELYWISLLPSTVLNLPAPSLTDVELGDDNGSAFRQRLIDEALKGGAR